jgi:hypothetical protein
MIMMMKMKVVSLGWKKAGILKELDVLFVFIMTFYFYFFDGMYYVLSLCGKQLV